MKLNASAMISRHTTTSSRSLLAFSATVFLVSVYELGNNLDPVLQEDKILSNWKILGVQIPDNMFVFTILSLMLFFLVNHVLHWWADYQSYTKWFDLNSVPIGTWDVSGTLRDEEPPVKNIIRKLDSIEEHIGKQNQNEQLQTSINDVKEILSRMEKNFRDVSRVSKVHIFGWYLGFPIAVWFLAIVSFFCRYVLR